MEWIRRLFAKKDKPEMKIPEKMGPEMKKALIKYQQDLEGLRWGSWQLQGVLERGHYELRRAAQIDWENEQKALSQPEITPSE